MASKLILYHHLGLGDHIICNGMVRCFAAAYDEVKLFVKKHNAFSVRWLFLDLKNVTLIPVIDDIEARQQYNLFKSCNNYEVMGIGYMGKEWDESGKIPFDQQFYKQAGICFSQRWDQFHLPRNSHQEVLLLTQRCPVNKKYAFVHDDIERGYCINRSKMHSDITKVSPGRVDNFFNYAGILKNATEIHCINSAFLLLADSILTKGDLYFHKYARDDGAVSVPTLKKDWKVYSCM